MIIVKTEEELNKAIKKRKEKIRLEGPLAKKYINDIKKNNIGTSTATGSIVIPVTALKYLLKMLTVVVGGSLLADALKENYNIKLDKDGTGVEFNKI